MSGDICTLFRFFGSADHLPHAVSHEGHAAAHTSRHLYQVRRTASCFGDGDISRSRARGIFSPEVCIMYRGCGRSGNPQPSGVGSVKRHRCWANDGIPQGDTLCRPLFRSQRREKYSTIDEKKRQQKQASGGNRATGLLAKALCDIGPAVRHTMKKRPRPLSAGGALKHMELFSL